jgi:hypothetical protein
MKYTLILWIVLLTGASDLKGQAEEPEKIEKGQYYMLRKDIHDELERQILTLDSLQETLDSLNRVNRNIYSSMLTLESELERKMDEAYFLRQSLVENQIFYELTQDQYNDLRKKYFKLKYHKPEKVIITRKKFILPSEERKIIVVMGALALTFVGLSIGITSMMQ